MEKLPMCRICLAEDVRMYVVANKKLQKLYEKLTDIPFVTEDRRPSLACFFCCAKLKQCFRLMTKCMEAEQLFAQMMNENYEPNSLIKPDYCSGFITTPIVHISIVEKGQTQSNIAIKEESPEVCEGVDDIQGNLSDESIDIKEEVPEVCEGLDEIKDSQSDDLEPEEVDNNYLDVKDMHPLHSESDSEGDVPLLLFKTEVEEPIDASKMKQRAVATNSAPVTRRTKLEDTTTAQLKKNEQSYLKVFRTTRNRTSKPGSSYEEPDECDQRSLNEVKTLKQHTRTRISKKLYECDVCQRNFSYKGGLTNHIRIHTGEKPFNCDVCQCSFRRKHNLSKHFRIHTGEKPYTCDVCQCSFRRKHHLSKHIRIHTGEKPYQCYLCQLSFNDKYNLIKHIRIHTGEKPFKCDVCQRSFSQNHVLKKHIKIHSGEMCDDDYKCNVCQRSFTTKYGLTKHIRIHTGEKPFKCDVCQLTFRWIYTLKRHVRTHTGEKP